MDQLVIMILGKVREASESNLVLKIGTVSFYDLSVKAPNRNSINRVYAFNLEYF